ncbi:MAG: AtpZ/AtpI family protein [Chloroflexota bacterium]|nr:AtpZ/AtpI family protein [Chloroflexota bacterium]
MAGSPLDRNRPTISVVQSLAVASQFGITLAVSVFLGYLAGQWLDGRFNTGIIFTLIGVLLGLATATTSTVTLFRATLRKSEREWRARTTQTTESARDLPDEGIDES